MGKDGFHGSLCEAAASTLATSPRCDPQICDPAFRQILAAYRSLRARARRPNHHNTSSDVVRRKVFRGFCFTREAIDCMPQHSLKDIAMSKYRFGFSARRSIGRAPAASGPIIR